MEPVDTSGLQETTLEKIMFMILKVVLFSPLAGIIGASAYLAGQQFNPLHEPLMFLMAMFSGLAAFMLVITFALIFIIEGPLGFLCVLLPKCLAKRD